MATHQTGGAFSRGWRLPGSSPMRGPSAARRQSLQPRRGGSDRAGGGRRPPRRDGGRGSVARTGPRGLPAVMREGADRRAGPRTPRRATSPGGRELPSDGPADASAGAGWTEAGAAMHAIPWEIRSDAGGVLGEVEAAGRVGSGRGRRPGGRTPVGRDGGDGSPEQGRAGAPPPEAGAEGPPARPRLAHHEAGHAVPARRLGLGGNARRLGSGRGRASTSGRPPPLRPIATVGRVSVRGPRRRPAAGSRRRGSRARPPRSPGRCGRA